MSSSFHKSAFKLWLSPKKNERNGERGGDARRQAKEDVGVVDGPRFLSLSPFPDEEIDQAERCRGDGESQADGRDERLDHRVFLIGDVDEVHVESGGSHSQFDRCDKEAVGHIEAVNGPHLRIHVLRV